MSLGPLHTISLDEARDEALGARKDLHAGRDPKAMRNAVRAKAISFDKYCASYIEDHAAGWKNAASRIDRALGTQTGMNTIEGTGQIDIAISRQASGVPGVPRNPFRKTYMNRAQ